LSQEPVDKIIDKLMYLNAYQVHFIASHSRIAEAWVRRIQYHVLRPINFHDLEGLEEWSVEIEPGPAEVHRHTDGLILDQVETLTDIEKHVRSFARITWIAIYECNFLLSPSVVECFTPMDSSLTQLTVNESPATLCVITSVLAALRRLERVSMSRT